MEMLLILLIALTLLVVAILGFLTTEWLKQVDARLKVLEGKQADVDEGVKS